MEITSARFFVYATDQSRSLQFYTEVLQLAVVDRVVGGSVLRAGTAELEVLQERRDEQDTMDRRSGFILRVDDADAAFAELEPHGVVVLTEPATATDGARIFYIADPDGLPIGIASEPPVAKPPTPDWLVEEQ